MANVLQDYFNRITALNRQRGMTGNMQYGKALDSSLAEGYFDSYAKNKAQSQSLANQKSLLSLQQQSVDNSSKALNHNILMGWAGLGMQGAGAAAKMYLGREKNQQQPTTNQQGITLPANYTQEQFSESLGQEGIMYDSNAPIDSNMQLSSEPQMDYQLDWFDSWNIA